MWITNCFIGGNEYAVWNVWCRQHSARGQINVPLKGLNHSRWVPCTSSWVPGDAPSAGWPSACTGLFPADRYPALWTEWAGPLSYSPVYAYTPGTTTNNAHKDRSGSRCIIRRIIMDTVDCICMCSFVDHRSGSVSHQSIITYTASSSLWMAW